MSYTFVFKAFLVFFFRTRTALHNGCKKNAMSYCVTFTRYLYAIAEPCSRGGRSEAQRNIRGMCPGKQFIFFNTYWATVPASTTRQPVHELRGEADGIDKNDIGVREVNF